jgi:plasmid stabilization system protein ParE
LKRPVLWSEDALNELDKSIAYIAARNPAAARKVLAEIRKAGNGLGVTATGRRGRVADTYEKSVTRRPYIIAYALEPLPDGGERVVILHVIHTARDWPQGQWPEE